MTQRWPEPTEDEHIPGPWEVRHVTVKWNAICPVGYVTRIAEQYQDERLTPRDHANARLLAAAPDLLEALSALGSAIYAARTISASSDGIDNDVYYNGADFGPALDIARAAIAKATGGAE